MPELGAETNVRISYYLTPSHPPPAASSEELAQTSQQQAAPTHPISSLVNISHEFGTFAIIDETILIQYD